MLQTPFGIIRILSDGVLLDYEAVPRVCNCRSIQEKPLAGNYCITVPTAGRSTIQCEVDWCREPIRNTGDSGERYLCAEFVDGRTVLTIGIEDGNLAFESIRCDNGMAYRILQPPATTTVVFGIAWATDYEDGDVRTWLAADPT